jgi:hypothetical protein
MFKRMFGKGKNDDRAQVTPPPAARHGGGSGGAARPTQAINRVGDTLEAMELREQLLEKKVATELASAQAAMAKKNKTQALTHMKRKKMYEEQLVKLAAQKSNVETMQMTVEDAAMTAQVLEAQRVVGQQLERANNQMGVEQVEDDMDRIREAMEKQKEVADMLGQDLGGEVVDDDELLGELEDMVNDDQQMQAAAQPARVAQQPVAGIDLPSVPTGDIQAPPVAAVEEDEDAEALRQLEEELNA